MTTVDDALIFDVGMNKGEDTEFYLAKGFRVVAIEANPLLVAEATARLGDWIASGRLTVLPVGIGVEKGAFPFYWNLDNDHWSSFDPAYGCRDNTRYEVLRVDCVEIGSLLQTFGTPRYMKIDVEGADRIIMSDLIRLEARPRFVSVEEYGVQSIHDLHTAGYDRFQLVRQRTKFQIPPSPAREGSFVAREFTGLDSGLFGLELPGAWLGFRDFLSVYETFVRRPDHTYVGPDHEWFDVHASNASQLRLPT
jgi:FkbM family methyltransferase